MGSGSQVNFPMLQVSFRDADKVFLSHLHVDHVGDLDTLWLSGWVSNRYDRPLRVWGPSGAKKKYGTRHFIEKQVEAWAWDIDSRHGKLPAAGAEIEVNEFDYSKTHVVYEENGVKITAIRHCILWMAPSLTGSTGTVSVLLIPEILHRQSFLWMQHRVWIYLCMKPS